MSAESRLLISGLVLLTAMPVAAGVDCAVGQGTRVMDGDLRDWCLDATPRQEDSSAFLACPLGSEVVWWDAPADSAVNDLATFAVTQDDENLYWAFVLHVNPDPSTLPVVEVAIDVAPGGSTTWWDPQSKLQAPGHCSSSTSRACTTDTDCHFCAVSTDYTGTPHERPRVCGSTDAQDLCDWLNPADVCIRVETCEGLDDAAAVSDVGLFSSPTSEADYLLVIDFSRWLVGMCDSVLLLRDDGGNWVEVPRQVPDPNCPHPTWRFQPLVSPGTAEGPGGPPPGVEIDTTWEAFDCEGCAPFGPGDCFRWTVEVGRGFFNLDYMPDAAVEDVMTEVVAGTTSRTTNSCPGPGVGSLFCEIGDGSTDAYAPGGLSATPGGRIDGLTLTRTPAGTTTPAVTLSWNPSCSQVDTDYAVYDGELDSWYDHQPLPGLCSTGSATTATFDADAGDRYYLVVPTDGSTEGSYGLDGAAAERPAATSPCRAQFVGGCP